MSEHETFRFHHWLVLLASLVMFSELGWLLYSMQWFNALLVSGIILLILSPTVLRHRLPVSIPAEFQFLAQLFIFAALFLGEIRGYYLRLWWWDIALHASSGLLLGLTGFLLVFVLNENRHADLNMRPRFVALFAFVFAVSMGALWEIFEFSMDLLLGTDMQKTMLGDTSGLTDTMWDLVVDTLGALLISLWGWWFMHRRESSLIEVWVRKFIEGNPDLFRN